MMLRSIKLALATHLLLWGVCRGTPKGTLTQSEFYAASWEVVNSPSTSVTKWGPIEDWDTSGVPSFKNAFSMERNEAGEQIYSGNPKAAAFNGDISKWNTTSVTSLYFTFRRAAAFNSDMSKWITSSVTDMGYTFYGASSFTGTGVDLWNINKVKTMNKVFFGAIALTSCNKRKIADAWKSNAAFTATTYDTSWATDTCPMPPLTQSEFYAATWEVVNSPLTSVTKWGPIEDWDTSGVPSFKLAFSTERNEAGWLISNGNPKAATFNGDISKWITTSISNPQGMIYTFDGAAAFNGDVSKWIMSSVKSLESTFNKARAFNSDLSKWDTSSVTDMGSTFKDATSFNGTGVDLWNITKVKGMRQIFSSAKITSCNKRKIADAWKSSAAWEATFYDKEFAAGTCQPQPAKLSGGNSPTATTSLVGVVAATAMATAAVCLP